MHPSSNRLSRATLAAGASLLTTFGFLSSAFAADFGWSTVETFFSSDVGKMVVKVLVALAILIGGWLLAKIASYIVFKVLCKVRFDNVVAEKLGLTMLFSKETLAGQAVERFTSKVVYYILLMLVLVAALESTGLEQVASPIEGLVNSLFQAFPSIAKAGIILGIAYVAAVVLRAIVTRATTGLDSRFAELTESKDGESSAFSGTLGNVVFWLLMVIGLTGALQALAIDAISQPLSNAIDQIVSSLPKLAKAVVIALVFYVAARIVRTIVTNLLSSIGLDRLVPKLRLEQVFAKMPPSQVAGLILFYFIVLQGMIAAFGAIELTTISEPLTSMMAQFWTGLLPKLLVAALIVAIGVVISRLLRGIVENVLKGLGFDRLMEKLGFGQLAGRDQRLDQPSEFVALLVQVGVILLAVAQALDSLGADAWASYLNTFLGFVIIHFTIAVAIVLIGFAIGNYVRDLVVGDGSDESRRWVAILARSSILVFAFTMAVHHLGVAQDFVLLAFALLFGALCLALGLAFGLGSREVAGDIVQRQYSKVREQFGDDPTPPGKPAPASSFLKKGV